MIWRGRVVNLGSSWPTRDPSRRGRGRRYPAAAWCRVSRSPPFCRERGADPLTEPGLLVAPTEALGQEDLVDTASFDRDPFLLVEIGRQTVERPAAKG